MIDAQLDQIYEHIRHHLPVIAIKTLKQYALDTCCEMVVGGLGTLTEDEETTLKEIVALRKMIERA